MLMPSIFGENLFDDFFGDFPFYYDKDMKNVEKKLYGRKASHVMKTDIKETDNGYELVVDLPGFTKDEVQATLENGYLTISAEKGLDKEEIVGAGVGVPGPADEEGNVPVAVNLHWGFVPLSKELSALGDEIGVVIRCQHEDIFNKMHRI